MIGKPVSNASFRSSLDYLAGKPEARMIATNMEGRNPRELAREFGVVRRLRPTLGKAVFHAPLRLAVGEHLSEAQWRRVAERVIAGMGLTDCPWVVYLHPDEPGGGEGGGRGNAGGRAKARARADADGRGELGKGVQAHLVASRVNFLGQVISDSRSLERLALIERRIERDYRLREVPLVRNRVRRPGSAVRSPPRPPQPAAPCAAPEAPASPCALSPRPAAAPRPSPGWHAIPVLTTRC